MKQVLLVGLGGGLGSMARFLLGNGLAKLVPGVFFPWGTLTVNVLGCVAMGAVAFFALDRASLGDNARVFLAAGILGGFTTFSAFSQETVALLDRRNFGPAVAYVAASVVLGLAGVWAGRAACRAAMGA